MVYFNFHNIPTVNAKFEAARFSPLSGSVVLPVYLSLMSAAPGESATRAVLLQLLATAVQDGSDAG
jgi:hypothetical protein